MKRDLPQSAVGLAELHDLIATNRTVGLGLTMIQATFPAPTVEDSVASCIDWCRRWGYTALWPRGALAVSVAKRQTDLIL